MAATIIGIDPHKESWTAVAVDPRGQKLASVRAPVTEAGYRQLRRFADRYQEPVWAIEGAYGLGAHLSALLAGDGVTAWDVPAKLAARVRVLSSGHCRKSDEDDALSVAVAATTSTKLRRVHTDPAATELKVLTELRCRLRGQAKPGRGFRRELRSRPGQAVRRGCAFHAGQLRHRAASRSTSPPVRGPLMPPRSAKRQHKWAPHRERGGLSATLY